MEQDGTPPHEEMPEGGISGIEEVIPALNAGPDGWDILLGFSERSFYQLNEEFDKIREGIVEAEEQGDFDVAQHQMRMANFFVSARDNSVILNALARLGTEIENIHLRLDGMEKQLKSIRPTPKEK